MLFSAEIRLASGVQDWKKRGMRSRIQTPPTIRLPPLILDTDSLYILVLGHWLTKSWWMVYRWHFCCDDQIGHRINITIKWPCHLCGMASRALSQSFIPFVYGFSKGPYDSASQTTSHPLADLLDPSGVANLLCNAP
jgi:hypothetical protein